jgi:hypothetical protein
MILIPFPIEKCILACWFGATSMMLIGWTIKRNGRGLRETKRKGHKRKNDIKETEKGARELIT